MTIITLLTDFGLKDGNVGVMKGVMLGIAPLAQIVDVSHFIQPQDILEAALILRRSAPFFPSGTIHVVVVDPGVGTERRPIGARLGSQFYVGPDNGTVTMLAGYGNERGWELEFFRLDRPEFWLGEVSQVFHGRDIFAPTAAYLANGLRLDQVGTLLSDPVLLKLPKPVSTASGWIGEVIHVDHFGNISTNILMEQLVEKDVRVRLGGEVIDGLVRTFGDGQPGDLISLFGSTGNLILAVVNGSAAQRLKVGVGEAVSVEWRSGQ